jgi:glycosyltransferase involved in cell wall biosynthesis
VTVSMGSDPDYWARWIPTVTVVLPTHNRPSLVKRAAESVLRQTYSDWELIIVDDASAQDIASGVAELLRDDRRVRLVRRTVNGGASAARNTGIEHAQGRFVCFLDDDDEYLGNKLAHQVNQLESAPDDVAGVAGAWFYATRPVDLQLRGEDTELRREQFLDFDAGVVQVGSVLLRRETVVELGFDESLPVIHDWDFYVRLLERHRMLRDSEPVMLMHEDAGRRLTANHWNRFRDLERLYEKYLPEISRDRRRHANWHGKMALDALELGYPTQARKHGAAAVRLSPGDPRPWYLLATAVVGNAPRRWLLAGYRRIGSLRRRPRVPAPRTGS